MEGEDREIRSSGGRNKSSARFMFKVHGASLVPKPIALQSIGRTVQLEQRNQAMNYFIGVLGRKMAYAGEEI